MRVTAQTVPVNVDVTLSMEDVIAALKAECGVRSNNNDDSYYVVENHILYKFTDVSYHGSPRYEKSMISDDENVVDMYEAIIAFEKAYKKTIH